MRTVHAVLFDRDERALFAKAALSTPIAFAEPGQEKALPGNIATGTKDPRLTLLRGLARGSNDPVHYPRLALAREVLSAIIAACEEQSKPEFFYAPTDGVHVTSGATNASALFADPDEAVKTLNSIREAQAADARAALALIEAALTQMTPADDPHHTTDDREEEDND